MRSTVLRVVALAVLLLLVLASVFTLQTMRRLPDTLIYFVRDTGSHLELEAVGRRGRGGTPEQRARWAIAELAAGPSESERSQGLASAVPAGTSARAIRLADGILHADLSSHFESGGGSAAMQGRLYQMLYTLSQPREIEGVVLQVEGRRLEALGGEGIIVESPWLRPVRGRLPAW